MNLSELDEKLEPDRRHLPIGVKEVKEENQHIFFKLKLKNGQPPRVLYSLIIFKDLGFKVYFEEKKDDLFNRMTFPIHGQPSEISHSPPPAHASPRKSDSLISLYLPPQTAPEDLRISKKRDEHRTETSFRSRSIAVSATSVRAK